MDAALDCRVACLYKGFEIIRVLDRLKIEWLHNEREEDCSCPRLEIGSIHYNQAGPDIVGNRRFAISAQLQGLLDGQLWNATLFPVLETNRILMHFSVGRVSCTTLFQVQLGSFLGLPLDIQTESTAEAVAPRSPLLSMFGL